MRGLTWKRTWRYAWSLLLLSFFTASLSVVSAENEEQLINEALPQIEKDAAQQSIIDALSTAARKPFSLKRTMEMDREWLKDEQLRKQIATHPLSAEFKKIVDDQSQNISEVLLIDIHGRLIASYPEASDYYQGDESKYIRPMTDRKYFADSPEWDDSTGIVAIQIAMPVFNDQKRIIGVIVESLEVNLRILTKMKVK